jgi:hypothetical protein
VAGERVDDVAGKVGAIGRRQRGALLAFEIILQTSSWSSLDRIRSTPDRLKSPLNSSCASGTIMAPAGTCVACADTEST